MAGTSDDVIWSSTQGLQDQFFKQVHNVKTFDCFGGDFLIFFCDRLLESGELSDAQVRCGKRTWKVHKAILCARSEWFRDAITGPFKVRVRISTHCTRNANENATGARDRHRHQHHQVRGTRDPLPSAVYLHRKYGFSSDKNTEYGLLMHESGINVTTTFTADHPVFIASISVWRVGKFFLLQDLCKLALDGFQNRLRQASWELAGTSSSEHWEVPIKNCVGFVRELYQQERSDILDAFRPATLSFLISVIHIFGKSPEFKDLLREIPGFSSDWAVAITNCMASIKTPPNCSDECAKCRKLGVTHLNRAKWFKEQKNEYLCEKCFPFPSPRLGRNKLNPSSENTTREDKSKGSGA